MRNGRLTLGICCAVLFVPALYSHAQLLGPTPYLSQLNSPFAADIAGGSVFLENFEDSLLNTPGVTASAGIIAAPGPQTDSVDADDGIIDGSGPGGHSWFSNAGGIGISFTFSAVALGGFPTRAGIVWTDGFNPITFEAFDSGGASLGALNGSHGDGGSSGTTAEDRFYGVIHDGGISRIHIRSGAGGGIEVDHLQYGRAIPEPGVLGLLMLGGIPLLLRRRR